jgi:hypothetical protein
VLQRSQHSDPSDTAAIVVVRSCSAFAVHSSGRGQHSDPLAQLPMFYASLQRLCSALCYRGVSTLILCSCHVCYALAALLCTVLQRSQHSDPLHSCPCLFCASFGSFLCSTVLQRSQHSDPLTQLPMFAFTLLQRSFAVHCVAESQHSDPLAQLPCLFTLCSVLCSALCCRESL